MQRHFIGGGGERPELGLDLRTVPHIMGVPRFMIGDAVRDLALWARALVSGSVQDRMVCEMRAAYFGGYWWDRHRA